MTIDPQTLASFPIPDIHERIEPRDAVFYALSIGLGADPLDRAQLRFTDADRGPLVVPSMAAVLGHPGFWLEDPATGVDAVRLLHGEQSVILHTPLTVGTDVIGRTRVTGLIDRGPAHGAVLYTQKQLIDAATGAVLATLDSTLVLRGDGGFGGPSGPVRKPAPAPEGTPAFVIDLPTRPEQALLYRLNGDDNPLHTDPDIAAAAGFPRPVLQGLCTFGVVCHALLKALCGYDPARLKSMSLRFSAPVFPGETIRTEIWPDGGFRARVAERDVIVINNGKAGIA